MFPSRSVPKRSSNTQKVFDSLGPSTLFYVEFDSDTNIVVFYTKRSGNKLVDPYVDLYWSNLDNLEFRDEVGKSTRETYFQYVVRPDRSSKVLRYDMNLELFSERMLSLRLKKSGATSAIAHINHEGHKKEVIVRKIYFDSSGRLPTMTIYGLHKKNGKKLMIHERVDITPEMSAKFGLKFSMGNLLNKGKSAFGGLFQ